MPELHLGVLFLLGIGAFGGILGASIFQRLRIPQVVGYIVIGVVIGQSGLKLVTSHDIITLATFNLFALGLIGFMVGGELHGETFRRYGKQFMAILLGEGLGAFLLVGAALTLICWHFLGNFSIALACGIVFAAIASATDPASTINVLWEYRGRGVLTTTLTAIVALDDALAMTLYGLGTSIAATLTGGSASLEQVAAKIGMELFAAIGLGIALGLLLNFILRWMPEKDKTLVVALGTLLIVIGLATASGMDVILASMALGVTLTNLAPRRSQELFSLVRMFSNPIYVIFFVLVGARLGIAAMPAWFWLIIIIYVVGRTLGKMGGAYWGARISHSPRSVRRYCGLGLFAQGGVAVGLSIMAGQNLSKIAVTPQYSLGDMIIAGVTATTLIVQILGPPMVKLAMKRAGEIGRNVTEEDVMAEWTARDAMEEEIPMIPEGAPLNGVMRTFADHEDNSYPVVDHDGKIAGIITLELLKNVIVHQDVWEWMLAEDIMIPVSEKVTISTPLKEAIDLMKQLHFDRIPVVRSADDDRAVGVLDLQKINKLLGNEVLRRQRVAVTPEKA